jgi:hypothetical protein
VLHQQLETPQPPKPVICARRRTTVPAERIARDEAAELDIRRTWGLRGRLRWALRRNNDDGFK